MSNCYFIPCMYFISCTLLWVCTSFHLHFFEYVPLFHVHFFEYVLHFMNISFNMYFISCTVLWICTYFGYITLNLYFISRIFLWLCTLFHVHFFEYLLYRINLKYSDRIGQRKHCRPKSDATERGVWSGSTLFTIHPKDFSHINRQ